MFGELKYVKQISGTRLSLPRKWVQKTYLVTRPNVWQSEHSWSLNDPLKMKSCFTSWDMLLTWYGLICTSGYRLTYSNGYSWYHCTKCIMGKLSLLCWIYTLGVSFIFRQEYICTLHKAFSCTKQYEIFMSSNYVTSQNVKVSNWRQQFLNKKLYLFTTWNKLLTRKYFIRDMTLEMTLALCVSGRRWFYSNGLIQKCTPKDISWIKKHFQILKSIFFQQILWTNFNDDKSRYI